MNPLKFRRQYLLSSLRCEKLNSWKLGKIDSYYLYVHNDCCLNIISNNKGVFALVGYLLLPSKPNLSSNEILSGIQTSDPNEIANFLYSVTGRFVLFFKPSDSSSLFVYNDCCGLKTVYYHKKNGNLFIASQPNLMQLVTEVEYNENYYVYYNSRYIKTNKYHYPPSGLSLYKDVFHLIPNHYLKSESLKQIRYWPIQHRNVMDMQAASERFAMILKNTLIAANSNFKLAIAMTAGWDSRILLSASKSISKDVKYFTFRYRKLNNKSADIETPRNLLNKLGLEHDVIETRINPSSAFKKIYNSNSHIPHYNDWGIIAEGILKNFPQDTFSVRGGGAEIARYDFPINHYINVNSYTDLLSNVPGWDDIPFFDEHLSKWFNETTLLTDQLNYSIRDIFYWEHRLGSWLALNKLEWDIAHGVFVPFNNRELLDIALSVDSKYRHGPDFVFFRNVILNLWPEVLDVPINPVSKSISIKRRAIEKAKLVLGVNTFNTIKKYLKKQ